VLKGFLQRSQTRRARAGPQKKYAAHATGPPKSGEAQVHQQFGVKCTLVISRSPSNRIICADETGITLTMNNLTLMVSAPAPYPPSLRIVQERYDA
jgi:hypothetical protein